MTTETVRLDALVSLLLRRGYYPVAPEYAGEGAQLINGKWYMPRLGCDTLQYVIEEHGDEVAEVGMWVIEVDAVADGSKCYVANGSGDPDRTCSLEHAEVYATEREAKDNANAFWKKFPARKFNVVQIVIGKA